MEFKLKYRDNNARVCEIKTTHNSFLTPIFMPVDAAAAVKSFDAYGMSEILKAKIILINTYYLYLHPSSKVIKNLGGLHHFTQFPHSFLTDSGGFQAFSLSRDSKHFEEGIKFKGHIDGSLHLSAPQSVLETQYDFNSNVCTVLDDLVALPSSRARVELSAERTIKRVREAIDYHKFKRNEGEDLTQDVFGIIQGGTGFDLREKCALEFCEMDFDGLAIGELSADEENALVYEVVENLAPFIDEKRPRYLMGVGTPEDLVENAERGVNMFDCVIPTGNARNDTFFTNFGRFNIKKAEFMDDDGSIDKTCSCYTCQNYSRAYLSHLFRAKELTFFRLASLHNLHYYLNLAQQMREAIMKNQFNEFKRESYTRRS